MAKPKVVMGMKSKRIATVIRKAFRDSFFEAFLLGFPPPRPTKRSPADDFRNIAGYWQRTGDYIQHAMDNVGKEIEEENQMSLFEDCDVKPSHHEQRKDPKPNGR